MSTLAIFILLLTNTGTPETSPLRVRVLLSENTNKGRISVTHTVHIISPEQNKALRTLPPFSGKSITCQNGQIQLGQSRMPSGEILLVPEWNGALQWEGKVYRGSFLLRPISSSRFHVLNIVSLEDYVAGVLPTEMGSRAPLEALKAQAICARTYAVAQMKERARSGFDAYADVRDQVYGGVHKNPIFDRATRETRGTLLIHKTQPFKTYFHSTCGGGTESVLSWKGDPDIQPLSGSRCPSCSHAKWFRWTTHLTRKEISTALASRTNNQEVQQLKIREWNNQGRIEAILIVTQQNQKITISGTEFRSLLGPNKIRSTRWTVTPTPTGWSLLGKGWGHGVGLCQEGAMGFAKQGAGFQQILSRYYPGANLEKKYR